MRFRSPALQGWDHAAAQTLSVPIRPVAGSERKRAVESRPANPALEGLGYGNSRLAAPTNATLIRSQRRWWRSLLASVLLLGLAAAARADGGTVEASQVIGNERVTIFTSPNPLRAGPIDVSIWVQDAASGATLPDVSVDLELSAPQAASETLHAPATHAAATNKLFLAAIVDVPQAGRWHLTANCAGRSSNGKPFESQLSCNLAIAEPLPKWRSMWPWYSWPAVVVLLFVWRQWSMASA
jgi:hypothetical protein